MKRIFAAVFVVLISACSKHPKPAEAKPEAIASPAPTAEMVGVPQPAEAPMVPMSTPVPNPVDAMPPVPVPTAGPRRMPTPTPEPAGPSPTVDPSLPPAVGS